MSMSVAEWCETCGRRTLRSVGPCPECATNSVEASFRINQQLKSAIVELSRRFLAVRHFALENIMHYPCEKPPCLPSFWLGDRAKYMILCATHMRLTQASDGHPCPEPEARVRVPQCAVGSSYTVEAQKTAHNSRVKRGAKRPNPKRAS